MEKEKQELTLAIVIAMEKLLFDLEKKAGIYDREHPNYFL